MNTDAVEKLVEQMIVKWFGYPECRAEIVAAVRAYVDERVKAERELCAKIAEAALRHNGKTTALGENIAAEIRRTDGPR